MYATSLERCKYWKQCNKCEQCKPFMWQRYLQLWWCCRCGKILPLMALIGQVDHAHCKCRVYHYYWGEMCVFSGAGCLSMKRGYWELCLSFFPLACKEKEVSGTFLCPAQVIPSKEPKASPHFWFAKRKVAFIFISRFFLVRFQLHFPLDLHGSGLSIICSIYWSVLIDKW